MSHTSSSDGSNTLIPPAVHSRRLFLQRSATAAVMGTAALALLRSPRVLRADTQADPSPADRARFREQGGNFDDIRTHENDHVAFLVDALGKDARPKPTFKNLKQANIVDFVNVSQALEDTGVGAYLGAAPAIKSKEYLAAAASIALIEARHAGYLNVLVEDPITANVLDINSDNSFEKPLTVDQVVAGASMFIEDLNGGPAVDYSNTPSNKNDIAILNFALALEYLESSFYNINVPIFYP